MGKGVLRASGGGVTGGTGGSLTQVQITLSVAPPSSTNITTALSIAAPGPDNEMLMVEITQPSAGFYTITWGSSFDPTTATDIGTAPNRPTRAMFVSRGGVYICTGIYAQP